MRSLISVVEECEHEDVPVGSLDIGWVLDGVPWDLREALAPFVDTLCLHLEVALLGHGRVPAATRRLTDSPD
jgi:hypothetical protein